MMLRVRSCWLILLYITSQGLNLCQVAGRTSVLLGSKLDSPFLGTADTEQKRFLQLYNDALKWQNAYRANAAAVCSKQAGSLCSASAAGDDQVIGTVLMLAAAPAKYDARTDSAGPNPVAPVKDQGTCGTCAAFASAAAAEAAVSSALRIPAYKIDLSEQDIYACHWDMSDCPWNPNGCPYTLPPRTCTEGMPIDAALQEIVDRPIASERCLKYNMRTLGTTEAACQYSCHEDDGFASKGSFEYFPMDDWAAVMKHIRDHGGVVTAIQVYDDMKPFFANTPDAVYKGPSPGARGVEAHAIVLVGYNIREGYWICKDSKRFTQGYFKLAFGAAGAASPFYTFGMQFKPFKSHQPLLKMAPAPGRPGCFLYQAGPRDNLERIVDAAKLPSLQQLLLDNVGHIRDLRAPLAGKQLLLCAPGMGGSLWVAVEKARGN